VPEMQQTEAHTRPNFASAKLPLPSVLSRTGFSIAHPTPAPYPKPLHSTHSWHT